MTPIPRFHKVFYGVIFAAALHVAVSGYFFPPRLAAITSWLELPPLHARIVGALYFFGAVFMVNLLLARAQAEARSALGMIAIFTGLLFVVSLLSISAFDFSQFPPWVWFASYSIYPLIAIGLAWQSRGQGLETVPGAALPGWARGFLLAQGALVMVLAVLLIAAPSLMTVIWPWKITPLLAQTYGGPLLAYGWVSWQYAGRKTWAGARAPLPGMFVFTTLVLLASVMHRKLFSSGEAADLMWFVLFGTATLFLGTMLFQSIKAKRSLGLPIQA